MGDDVSTIVAKYRHSCDFPLMLLKSREDYWFIPAAILTGALGLLGLWLTPNKPTPLEALEQFAGPAFIAAVVAVSYKIFIMLKTGEDKPIRSLLEWAKSTEFRSAAIGVSLASTNLTAFLWMKRGLNIAVPFTKDEVLADIDHMIFFGRDPWTYLSWLDNSVSAIIYHPFWLLVLLATLLLVFSSPPSKERNALILTYFLMWSVAGPLIHTLLPAAGPLFFENLGLGDRFSGLGKTGGTKFTADYLWQSYESGASRYGSGISAVPSMHVTTACWITLVFYRMDRSYFVPALLFCLTIFTLSVALGWHYAVDGLIGGTVTLSIWLGIWRIL